MRVSQKTEYALRALLDLSLNATGDRAARTSEIAKRARVPEKFLEAILVELRKAGLVRSRRGPDGGHALARAPAAITLGQIRTALDGPLTLVEPAPRRRSDDPVEAGIRETWHQAEIEIGAVLEAVSLEAIQRRVLASQSPDFSI
jgi:Rrf2 family protein